MAKQSTLRLIKTAEEFLSVKEDHHFPADMRGIYVLYRHRLDRYDVVYVGMGHIRFRLRSHLKKKANLFTHYSIFEVHDNITDAEVEELEGLFRHLYRFDSGAKASGLNLQRSYNKLKQLPGIFPIDAGVGNRPLKTPQLPNNRSQMMTDLSKAKTVFRKAGLAFPCMPKSLASSLRKRGKWLYSTRPIKVYPYFLNHYVDEASKSKIRDYALLAHSGYGVNSYAIQYYLIYGPLRMFLFLGWGGVYMDSQKEAGAIQECFSLADRIASAATEKLPRDGRLTIVVSDFYGNYWCPQYEAAGEMRLSHEKTPQEVLQEALSWLDGLQRSEV